MMVRVVIPLLSLCVLVAPSASQSQTEVPNEFQAGQPARASEVNENFNVLEQAVQDLELSSSNLAIQIQSVIEAASWPRWTVRNFYSRLGRWPVHNAEAGAEAAFNYQTDLISRIDISQSIVTVTFRDDIRPELAGRTMSFGLVDNTGSISVNCLVPIDIEQLLPPDYCMMEDRPPTFITAIWDQIRSAVALASETRWLVEDYHGQYGTFPGTNAEARAAVSTQIVNDFVTQVEVAAGGEITAVFGPNAHANIIGDSITFVPTDNSGSITWSCRTSGLQLKWMPDTVGGRSCVHATDKEPTTVSVTRQQVSSAFPLAARLQAGVDTFRMTNGTWPTSNADIGEPPANQFIGNNFDSIGVLSNGTGIVSISYGRFAHPALVGNDLWLIPTVDGVNINWDCESSTIDERFLPHECKNPP